MMDSSQGYNAIVDVIYIDEDLLVVNKPSGLPVLPEGWDTTAPYLVKILESDYGKLWVVHRLDKVTSGVLLFARNANSHRELNRLFETREIKKTYHAIVCGLPLWDEHIARHPLRVNVGHSHRTVVDQSEGRQSETIFHVLERYKEHSLLEVHPLTGRTHQVRVHSFALGFPLLGDTLYSAPSTDLIDRPALHAFSLQFLLNGHMYQFTAPYPLDFSRVINKLRTG